MFDNRRAFINYDHQFEPPDYWSATEEDCEMHTLVLASGGLDSTVLVYYLLKQKHVPHLLFIDYGQRHIKEQESVELLAKDLGLPLNTAMLTLNCKSSPLINQELVLAPDDARATVVPNRNAIFANIAAGIAADQAIQMIALAIHAGDHRVYKDCRPEFVKALQKSLYESLDLIIEVYTPFLHLPKSGIVLLGDVLNVPFHQTWSCYEGGEHHCGLCPACTERRKAFTQASVLDTTYYWNK